MYDTKPNVPAKTVAIETGSGSVLDSHYFQLWRTYAVGYQDMPL